MSDKSAAEALEEVLARMKAAPEGPYYVGPDDAEDAPDHADSGLAMIDTGRTSDWPIARLCEWGAAAFVKDACNFLYTHADTLRAALAQPQEGEVEKCAMFLNGLAVNTRLSYKNRSMLNKSARLLRAIQINGHSPDSVRSAQPSGEQACEGARASGESPTQSAPAQESEARDLSLNGIALILEVLTGREEAIALIWRIRAYLEKV